MLKIGFGYDAHRLVKSRDLVLGGVKIPYKKGLLGYSDADVLSHAVGNAILGALSLGDLGKHFPSTDKRYKGISSLKLLLMIKKKIKKAEILHIGFTGRSEGISAYAVVLLQKGGR
jgi:2-C-methyl-D-erythritol 2,4-cyclodiphosphate synthase